MVLAIVLTDGQLSLTVLIRVFKEAGNLKGRVLIYSSCESWTLHLLNMKPSKTTKYTISEIHSIAGFVRN